MPIPQRPKRNNAPPGPGKTPAKLRNPNGRPKGSRVQHIEKRPQTSGKPFPKGKPGYYSTLGVDPETGLPIKPANVGRPKNARDINTLIRAVNDMDIDTFETVLRTSTLPDGRKLSIGNMRMLRMFKRTESYDDSTAIQAEKLLLAYEFGSPAKDVNLRGGLNNTNDTTVEFIITDPSASTPTA